LEHFFEQSHEQAWQPTAACGSEGSAAGSSRPRPHRLAYSLPAVLLSSTPLRRTTPPAAPPLQLQSSPCRNRCLPPTCPKDKPSLPARMGGSMAWRPPRSDLLCCRAHDFALGQVKLLARVPVRLATASRYVIVHFFLLWKIVIVHSRIK